MIVDVQLISLYCLYKHFSLERKDISKWLNLEVVMLLLLTFQDDLKVRILNLNEIIRDIK